MTTTLKLWNPFHDMEELSLRLNPLFNQLPREIIDGNRRTEKPTTTLPVDIAEEEKQYLIQADLPALNKSDIKVRVEQGVLYISGERKAPQRQEGRQYHRMERSHGAFERTFQLPSDADAANVTAGFKDGVLTVHLPKLESAKPRHIEVTE
jgi:HSP20 family protein